MLFIAIIRGIYYLSFNLYCVANFFNLFSIHRQENYPFDSRFRQQHAAMMGYGSHVPADRSTVPTQQYSSHHFQNHGRYLAYNTDMNYLHADEKDSAFAQSLFK